MEENQERAETLMPSVAGANDATKSNEMEPKECPFELVQSDKCPAAKGRPANN
jgi:hypothetical protein